MRLLKIEKQIDRLKSRWGEKSFCPEVVKRIFFYTNRMTLDDVEKMINFFLDNNKFAPLPKDFADYAKSHGYTKFRKEPTENCRQCKNRGHFTAIRGRHKFFFDCPALCPWNKFFFGGEAPTAWKSEYRKLGFKLEHEAMERTEIMQQMLKNTIEFDVLGLAKDLLKGSGYDQILEQYEAEKDIRKKKEQFLKSAEVRNGSNGEHQA